MIELSTWSDLTKVTFGQLNERDYCRCSFESDNQHLNEGLFDLGP